MDDSLDTVWKALSDATRRELLDLLRDGPHTTGALSEAFPELSRFAVMKHLGVLEEAGLVTARREGRKRWNHLNAVPLRRIYERWVSKYEDAWAGSLIRLKRLAEDTDRKPKGDTEMGIKLLDQPARVAIVEAQIDIKADRERVFRSFLEDTADWFYESEESRKTRPARIEPRVGGLFTIDYDNGDRNMIAMVTMIKKNREVRLRGDCTIPQAFVANMTVKFEDLPTASGAGVSPASGARVSVTHRMAGEFDDDLPAGFEEGWADGLEKLKSLVEAG